jgi:carboxymethylenebutenolidase
MMQDTLESHLKSLVGDEQKFDRRGFVVTSLGAGFALAVMPLCAQTMISTPADGLVAGEVKVPVKEGEIPAYRAMPATGSGFPTLVVVHEAFGVHEHIRDVTRRFAKLGYFAIAPELYARQGDPSKVEMSKLLTEIIAKVPDAQVDSDLDATVAYARSTGQADTARLGITGFCWGGRTALMYAAHNPDVKAAVPWYGSPARAFHPGDRTPLEVAGRIKAAVLGLYGGADAGISEFDVDKMRDALKASGNANVEFVVYPDAPHAFFADYRPSYRKEAAEDAWERAIAWFRKYGVA